MTILVRWRSLSSLLSVDGVLALFFSFLGKVWYVGCSTFFLAWWGIVFLIHQVYNRMRKKEMGEDEHRILFLLLAFLGALAINCIYMSYFGRVDTLIYGRYSEYVYILILFVGLYAMMQSRHRGKLCALFLWRPFFLRSVCVVFWIGQRRQRLFIPTM